MADGFVNLHNHSEYSLLDGFGTVSEYIDRAVALGQKAIGLTDHGDLYGIHQFILECNSKGIKPIPGIEAYMAPQNPEGARCHKPVRYGKPGQESIDVAGSGAYLHLTLFAMNQEGLNNLYLLERDSGEEGNRFNHLPMKNGEGNFYMKGRMDMDMLAEHNAGIIATTGCPSGEIQTRLRLGEDTEAYDYARRMKEIFDGRYFVEIMNHSMHGDIERATMGRLLTMAKDLDLPLLATNDAHYCNREDAPHHAEMLCVNSKASMNDATSDNGGKRFAFDGDQYYLKSAEEMREALGGGGMLEIMGEKAVDEAIANTVRLADMVEPMTFSMRHDLRPHVPIPEGETDESYFRKKVEEGYQRKRVQGGYSKEVLKESRERIAKELPIFIENDFMQYMLVVQDYIKWARSKGIGVGFGRGSVGGSEVAFVMDISDTDPIRYNLLFERFLNPERISPPDVDTDFAASRRDEVLDYVKDKYGEDHIANVVTFNRFMSKTALKDMARIYDIPVFESEKAAKLIPMENKAKPADLSAIYDPKSDSYKEGAEFREMMEQKQWRKPITAARAIEGRVKTTGVHACAVIMSSVPISEVAPMTYKHLPEKPWGSSYCEWTYQELESMGLIKMDFLSLSDLDIVAKTIANIKHTHDGKAPDMHDLVHGPMDDAATYRMLANGDTTGVFQLSSDGMKSLLRRMKPTEINDILASVALYRPGPMGMDAHIRYADRKSGRERDEVIDDAMDSVYKGTPVEDILKPTHGLCVYQEQIMNIGRQLSGFSWGQADVLRKGMGHKDPQAMKNMEANFVDGAGKLNGINHDAAEKLWDYIMVFSQYGFNKSHSASYGIISYETAYLKCHYPTEFMASYLDAKFENAKSPDEKKNAIKEIRQMGLTVAGIDVNRSDLGMVAVKKTSPDDPDISFGFSGVSGLSDSVAEDIIKARERVGQFKSVDHFMRSLPVSAIGKKTIDGIGGAGGFDRLGVTRRAVVLVADEMFKYYREEAKARDAGKESLFDLIDDDEDTDDTQGDAFRIPDIAEWDWITKLEQEEERLGVIVSGHPMSNLGDGLRFLKMGYLYNADSYGGMLAVSDLYNIKIASRTTSNGRVWHSSKPVRVLVTMDEFKERTTRGGKKILTGTVEDMQDSIRFRMTPDDYAALDAMPVRNHDYVLTGNLTLDWNENLMLMPKSFDELTLDVRGVLPIWIRMTAKETESKGYRQLMRLLEDSRVQGDIPVMIHVRNENGSVENRDTGRSVGYSRKLVSALEKLIGYRRFGRWA